MDKKEPSEEEMHAWIREYSIGSPVSSNNTESFGQTNGKKVVKRIRRSNGVIVETYSDGSSVMFMPRSTTRTQCR